MEEHRMDTWQNRLRFYESERWKCNSKRILERKILSPGIHEGLTVQINAPFISHLGIQPIRNDDDLVLFELDSWLARSNELRWRIYQNVDDEGVNQRLVIGKAMRCLSGKGTECSATNDKSSFYRCCGRIEVGAMSDDERLEYKEAISERNLDRMITWILDTFSQIAESPHHKVKDGPNWLYSTPEASARMRWMFAFENKGE